MNFIGTIDYIKDDTMLIKLDGHSTNELKDIKTDKEYLFKIESMKEKRTLQQNRYIWEIISQIDKKVNGYMSDDWGTSKFDKKEMADFIECLIDRAYQEGIDVYGYEELLKGVKSGRK